MRALWFRNNWRITRHNVFANPIWGLVNLRQARIVHAEKKKNHPLFHKTAPEAVVWKYRGCRQATPSPSLLLGTNTQNDEGVSAGLCGRPMDLVSERPSEHRPSRRPSSILGVNVRRRPKAGCTHGLCLRCHHGISPTGGGGRTG